MATSKQGRRSKRLGRPFSTTNRVASSKKIAQSYALYNQALDFAAASNLADALTAYRAALKLNPKFAEAHTNIGNVLLRLGKWSEAEQHFRHALRLHPGNALLLLNVGIALQKQGQVVPAEEHLLAATTADPGNAFAFNALGTLYQDLQRFEEAICAFRSAIAIDPDIPGFRVNLGAALRDHGALAEAISVLHTAVSDDPNNADAHNNLGSALHANGEIDSAISRFQMAIELQPDHPDAHWNLSHSLLLQGHFESGLREYEWRWRTSDFQSRGFRQPLWKGDPLHGKTILVYAEQGLGDSLHFIRYASLLQALGGRVVFECPPALRRLLGTVGGIDELVEKGSTLPSFDTHAPLLSLPHLFDTRLSTIPNEVPYIAAESSLVQVWKERLGGTSGLRVGIAWQGNPRNRSDRGRSIPLQYFTRFGDIEELHLISLQKQHGREWLARLGSNLRLEDLDAELDAGPDAFVDTAAVMMNLDVIVTSDTAIAHLAGALGRPVWVALRHIPEWRWQLSRTDSPWYPSMRLFRQPSPGDWESVFSDIAHAIKELN